MGSGGGSGTENELQSSRRASWLGFGLRAERAKNGQCNGGMKGEKEKQSRSYFGKTGSRGLRFS